MSQRFNGYATKYSLFLSICVGLGLIGCSTTGGMSTPEKLALYNAHAGAPVSKFRFLGTLNGWTPLGDSAVAIWTRPSEAWLLDLGGRCPDLEYTPTIGLTEHFGEVSAKFDKVLVRHQGAINMPCHISQIRPLDTKAIKQAEKAVREQPKP